MPDLLKKYIEQNYRPGKRDLYAAFILRNLSLCVQGGRVSMVTQRSWTTLTSFAELRSSESALSNANPSFRGLLRSTKLEALVQLGRYAFSEADVPIDSITFILRNELLDPSHEIWACRITAPRPAEEQARMISMSSARSGISRFDHTTTSLQEPLLKIPNSPLVYYLPVEIIRLLVDSQRLNGVGSVRQGLATADDNRFVRNSWEIPVFSFRWAPFTKGGGYRKWFGHNIYVTDWQNDGARSKSYGKGRYQSTDCYFLPGWSYSVVCRGSASYRRFDREGVIGHIGVGVFCPDIVPITFLQSHIGNYILRALGSSLKFEVGTVALAPIPKGEHNALNTLGMTCENLKRKIISADSIDRSFSGIHDQSISDLIETTLSSVEGVLENYVCTRYDLSDKSVSLILQETGTPAGFYPLVAGYDLLPELPAELDLPPLPQEVLDYLAAHERIAPSPTDLRRIKERLRVLYEAGPGATEDDAGEAEAASGEDEEGEGATSGAHIPIPTETFLEELSVKLQLHPISVYWLLEELRREGARCKPEERRLLEDRLSVLVLRLLGHRWPKQIEAGEPVPAWADRDGIIAMAPGPDGLAERVRARLREEDGDVGANRAEGLLIELTGLSLEEWLRREFFKRHVRQFKYRPIAWHLASDPAAAAGGGGKGKGRGGKRQPAFECLLYYHATAGDALARVRTQYVEPLLRVERQNLDAARRTSDETTAAQAQARIQELEEFTRRLREVEEQGFACPELDKTLADELLDRWSGDGLLAPAERDDLLRQERAWRVDLNDGVRVNIAPLQLAGLLVSDVLKAADAKKAIIDRSRWRSDERRWVREGKLPRCGWMPDSVPESEAWKKLAPQREAERRKLEEKRKAALGER